MITNHAYDTGRMDNVRNERDRRLSDCDWLILRHIGQEKLVEEQELTATTITAAKYVEWEDYRQELRDFPSVVDLDDVVWPTEPT